MLDLLINESAPSVSFNDDIDRCFFKEGLDFLITMKEEQVANTKMLYKAMLESNADIRSINEGFNDFIKSFKEAIKKFITFLKSVIDKFILSMNKLVASEKYIKKHKDQLIKYNPTLHPVSMDMFSYTLSSTVPSGSALTEFNASFVGLETSDLDAGELKDKVKSLYDETVEDNEDVINKFRGKVLGKGESVVVYQDDFADELFKVYRNNSDTKYDEEVTAIMVTNSLTNIENYKKDIESLISLRTRLEKEYKAVSDNIDKMCSSADANGLYAIDLYGTKKSAIKFDDKSITLFKLLLKAKSNQVVEMSAIHTLAITAKLDAYKERYKQDKELLYEVLNNIAKFDKGVH